MNLISGTWGETVWYAKTLSFILSMTLAVHGWNGTAADMNASSFVLLFESTTFEIIRLKGNMANSFISLSTRLIVNVLFGGIDVNSADGKIMEGSSSKSELEIFNTPLIERVL